MGQSLTYIVRTVTQIVTNIVSAPAHNYPTDYRPHGLYNYNRTTLDTTHNLSSSRKSFPTITDNYSIISNDINTEMMKLICNSPFKANRMLKHMCKEEKPKKYLNKYPERYLEIEEIIYTVDKRKLDNIKLNFEPFMPYNAEQFYCLACNTNILKDLDLLYEHACLQSHKINVNKIKNDKNSDELLKQYMQKISNEFIKCHICRSRIKNDADSIDAHINDNMHKTKYTNSHEVINNTFNSIKRIFGNLWYSIQKFSCVLCSINFTYKIEFIEHVIAMHNGPLLNQMFDFCIPCASLWLNRSDCYTEHCNDVMHKYLIKNKNFMIEDLPECIKKLLRQVDKTSDILSEETQILVNDNTHKEIIQSLKNTLHSSFPLIKMSIFGSRIIGLESTNSIIKIFLDCGNAYYSDHKKWLQKGNLEIIEEIIRKQSNEWEVKEERGILRTVIKLLYKRTRVQCDIFITNSLFVQSFQLIRSFKDSYPPCKTLILFIEKWFSCFDLPSKHGLINHAIAWLVIFYLQLSSDLPNVATLIKQNNINKFICGWNTAQSKNNNKSMQSISLLLSRFFQFYANFDYQHYIICPLMGYAVAKRAFINLDTLPKEMKPYINYMRESNNPECLRIDSPLCVQDPLDLSRNLTKAVNSITLKYFKQYCQDSAFILQQISMKKTENAN
nr:PREDICTED: uncharacterized protein LOC100875098 isoform X1 [Megachile rotundata]XP_012151145.1 PREDICTED: uncharacterized protein LOC100875098 isoform X1 [Megachile rotundata]XP_012151816.1 PREDICTED: uncharacterized protein LOC100875098 isoform X1 [Megachile rotundata]XP_012152416.1 PREDICTED: uncharacterized protein LOC100875098 isoform X1 [Megachile rotundata]